MTEDTYHEQRCELCNDIVHTYYYEWGYGSHSYNHKTHKPYEDKRIEAPEQTFTFKLCMDCTKKVDKIYDLLKAKRIEWYKNAIKQKQYDVKQTKKQIKDMEKDIPKMEEEIKKLRTKMRKLK